MKSTPHTQEVTHERIRKATPGPESHPQGAR
jgi:hypothetical protein